MKIKFKKDIPEFDILEMDPEYGTPIDDECYYDELETEYKKKTRLLM